MRRQASRQGGSTPACPKRARGALYGHLNGKKSQATTAIQKELWESAQGTRQVEIQETAAWYDDRSLAPTYTKAKLINRS